MNRRVAIIIAIVLGLAAVMLTNVYFQQREAQMKVEETRIVVAARDITKGSAIDHSMLAYKTVPVNFVQPGALRSREMAVGKTVAATIMAGEQVLSSKLVTPERGLTLAAKTPPGKRAVTIALDANSSVGGMIKPGDHVDILSSFTNPAVILTLFQDVMVLAVGQDMVAEEGERAATRVSTTRRESITLALSPQEVQILGVAMEYGKIRLTLRPRMETGVALPSVDLSQLPPVVDMNTLLRLYIQRPQEVKVPSVEVIRGLKREVTPLPQ